MRIYYRKIKKRKRPDFTIVPVEPGRMLCRGRMLYLCELESLDFRRVELAAVGREEDNNFSDDGRIEAEPVAATDFTIARADVTGRVDLETRRVVEAIVLDPLIGERRKPFALRDPRKLDLKHIVLDGDGLHLATVEVALTLVLDFHLTALESLDYLCR